MSSYIIAGSADSNDTAYCEEIARRIKAKYKNIDFRIVIKHPSEWEQYLQQICRIYGFLNKSNPIVYTFDGKIIGNKEAFINATSKYFGLPQELLLVPNLTNKINIKLANEQLQRKNIAKNNIKTILQKIQHIHNKLLKEGQLKHEFQNYQEFLIQGIEYSFNEVQGICPNISYPLEKKVQVQKQDAKPENIDLLALSLHDQVKPEDGGKETFVTNNQQVNTQSMEKMSEASKTNRLHSSVMSRDGDSKLNKEDNGRDKQKIDEEFDDVADFTDHNMENMAVCQIGDNFYLGFEKQKHTHIQGEMVFYLNENQNNGNCIRIYNDGRPVKGHRNLIKEVHFNVEQNIQKQKEEENQEQKGQEENQEQGEGNEEKKEKEEEKPKEEEEPVIEKSKTEPNIPENNENPVQPPKQQQNISEPYSDLNFVSNLNHHTLYINRPLSQMQLKHLLYLIKQTNTIACLQFLPENPNPKIKVYNRKMIVKSQDGLFPVERFIAKQIEDQQYEEVILPKQPYDSSVMVKVKTINDLGYSHFYIQHDAQTNDQTLARSLKFTIDELLNLEETLKKQIGYNLIFGKNYTIVVALTAPYKNYGNTALYFDGLAYLGHVQVAKLVQAYKLKEDNINSGNDIRRSLGYCSGFRDQN